VEASRARRPLRRLAQRGRTADRSFEQLYQRHARDVYQYALAVLSNPADAEDVTQTTFLNAYRAFQKGERPQKPHNWLIAIAHNVCRMRWRQAGSRPKEVALDEAPEPAALDLDRPDLAEVLTALAQLSFNQRSALVMRELEGRSYQEIAEVLGVSVSAVEALLFRARRRLQLKRSAWGAITAVPLPGSLAGLFGGGGGAVAAGGAVLGSDLVLKAVAAVAVGVVAGAGYKTVDAVSALRAATGPQQAVRSAAPTQYQRAASATRRTKHAATTQRLRHAGRATGVRQTGRPSASTTSGTAPVQPAAATPSGPSAPLATTATPPPAVVVKTPPLPPIVPPVTVTTPALPPLPPLQPLPPVPPVTVSVPTLPPPPPLP
jgi:RNA polymerase sigma-70 factor, ECF subfamily